MTVMGNLPPPPSPPDRILDCESAVGRRLSADRFRELSEVLWGIEEEKARVLQKLYERQKALLAKAEKEDALLKDVLAFIVVDDGILLVRPGDDEQQARICRRIDDLRKKNVSLVEEYLETYGEAKRK